MLPYVLPVGPQKRNPVAIEHARAIGSKALGQAQAILTTVHNTPFGDIVDTEDDLQPLVFSMFRDATRMVKLVSAAMATAEFDAARLESRAADGWTTLTEFADTLVRDHGVSFRTAHRIAAKLIDARQSHPDTPMSVLVADASRETLGSAIELSDAALTKLLSPGHFIEIRQTSGGPAPAQTTMAIRASRALVEADQSWWRASTVALSSAERRLAERSSSL